jgi:hypothetical protein
VFSPTFRGTRGAWLAERTPSLINSPGVTKIGGVSVGGPFFNDNLPLRTGVTYSVALEDGTAHAVPSPVINDVPGAMAIQNVFEDAEWAMFAGDSLGYIAHVRKDPLAGVLPKSIIFQFDTGDQNVPNPFSSAMLRAGDLADRATYYRHDLAFADDPTLPHNGHGFMTSVNNAAWEAIALGAQEQIGVFFASDGAMVIHPEPAQYFEVPIELPLPEDLNFIPDNPPGGTAAGAYSRLVSMAFPQASVEPLRLDVSAIPPFGTPPGQRGATSATGSVPPTPDIRPDVPAAAVDGLLAGLNLGEHKPVEPWVNYLDFGVLDALTEEGVSFHERTKSLPSTTKTQTPV